MFWTRVAVFFTLSFAIPGNAAINDAVTLGIREAKLLVENLPDFIEARDSGYCPVAHVGHVGVEMALISAARECGAGRYTIGAYEVHLTTGAVVDAITCETLNTPELESLRAQLFKERALSGAREADVRCLLLHLPASEEAKERGLCPIINILGNSGDVFRAEVLTRCASEWGLVA